MEAIRRDGRMGAWAEVDLRRLRSGGMVLMHDVTLRRTTNGWGKVEDRDLDYIRSLRTEPNRQLVPTFVDALIAAKAANTTLYIELKQWQQHWKPADLAVIANLVNARQMRSLVYFGGTRASLKALAANTPKLQTFWRTKNNDSPSVIEARKRSVEVVQTRPSQVSASAVTKLQAAGYVVALQGGANRPSRWQTAAKRGIHIVQTGTPDKYLRWCRTHA